MPILITKNSKLEIIISMLGEHRVSEEDRVVWMGVCRVLTDEDLDRIIKILHNLRGSEAFFFLVENMKQKFSAITNKNHDALERILKDEELFLLRFNKKL